MAAYGSAVLALSLTAARNLGLVVVIGLLVLSLIAFSVIRNVTAKIVTGLILAGLALGVWSQRDDLRDCANRIEQRVKAGDTSQLTCEFFGAKIHIGSK